MNSWRFVLVALVAAGGAAQRASAAIRPLLFWVGDNLTTAQSRMAQKAKEGAFSSK